MLEERGFNLGSFFTAIFMGFIVGLIVCEVAGFLCGLTWHTLVVITISDHAEDVLGDVFVRASEFSLLGGRDIFIFDGHLFHEVLTDGD